MSKGRRFLGLGKCVMGLVSLVMLSSLFLGLGACKDLDTGVSVSTTEVADVATATTAPDGTTDEGSTTTGVTNSSATPVSGPPLSSTTSVNPALMEGAGPVAPTITTAFEYDYYHVNEKDNGKTIYMSVGDRIEISLRAMPPGYDIRSSYDILERIRVMIAGGRDYIHFEAIEPGRETLSARWLDEEGVEDPDRRWEVYVVVSALRLPR